MYFSDDYDTLYKLLCLLLSEKDRDTESVTEEFLLSRKERKLLEQTDECSDKDEEARKISNGMQNDTLVTFFTIITTIWFCM